MRVRVEQTVMLGERVFDLSVLRQHGDVRRTKTLGGLALRPRVVIDPLLRHDPRGFLRERPAQLLGAGIASFAHVASSSECVVVVARGPVRTATLRGTFPRWAYLQAATTTHLPAIPAAVA